MRRVSEGDARLDSFPGKGEGMAVLAHVKVGGRPRTKGSLKVSCLRNARHTVRVEEEVAESKAWRTTVARVLREAQLREYGKLLKYAGPVEVRIVFHFPRDESVNGGSIPSHDTEWPIHITLGDADKLARNVLDALSAPKKRDQFWGCSGLIADDSQVVLLSVGKFWVNANTEPGAQILVTDVDDPAQAERAETVRQERIMWVRSS